MDFEYHHLDHDNYRRCTGGELLWPQFLPSPMLPVIQRMVETLNQLVASPYFVVTRSIGIWLVYQGGPAWEDLLAVASDLGRAWEWRMFWCRTQGNRPVKSCRHRRDDGDLIDF